MSLRHRALLLDLDGTLIDSAAIIRGGLRAALASLGLPDRSDAELSACIGLPIAHVWRRLGIDDPLHAAAVEGYRAWASRGGQDAARPFPGIDDLLQRLHAAGCVLVLATGKDAQAAARAIDRHGWRGFFAGSAGAEPADGPDKRGVAARAIVQVPEGLRPGAAMIGDMPLDGDAAQAVGIPFIAVGWGGGVPAELAAQRPAFTAATPQDLAGYLLTRR